MLLGSFAGAAWPSQHVRGGARGAIEQMTQDEKPSAVAALAPPAADGVRRVPGDAGLWSPTVMFGIIAAFLAGDVASDIADGARATHVAVEVLVMCFALSGVVVMWLRLREARHLARDLQHDLDFTRADLARWREDAQTHLRGLGEAIDAQFGRWGLTPAEREVALLLLKGLSLKEIADGRATSERTVRQQALSVYRKGGLAGRAELAAFFLEDLLLPGGRAGPAVG
jgi:DNA-binding CsgD family transcriptional regulator